MAETASTPAGWFPDPGDASQLRYWDGTQWTEHRAPAVAAGDTGGADAPSVVTRTGDASAHDEVAGNVGAGAKNSTDVMPARFPEPPKRHRGGLFGAKKDLEAELAELRALVDGFGYAERAALEAELERLRSEQARLAGEVTARRSELTGVQANLIRARDEEILQEIGIYDYHHRLEDATAYKMALEALRGRIKAMAKRDGGAVVGTTNWLVENSAAKGRKLVNDFSKLMLRAYNGEADVLVNKLRPFRLDAAVDQLDKARATISRLSATMHIRITDEYHQLRVEELRLTADYLVKKEEEKEAERAERERLREEAKAHQEFEAEKARLRKEQAHYEALLARLSAGIASPEEIAVAESKLAEIGEAIAGVEAREANIRTGYVYVISNFGSFGDSVVKIGLTRRLDPMDRVRELSDASVPFRYDVHALIFSEDAVGLEGRLHAAFADRRVNLVNHRREFFYATPREVEAVLADGDGALLEFVEEPIADEWRQSVNTRRKRDGGKPTTAVPSDVTPANADPMTGDLVAPGAEVGESGAGAG